MASSVAAAVSRRIHRLPEESFIRVRDLEVRIGAARHAIEVIMSRLSAEDVVQSIGRGVYWKGPRTRDGMLAPTASQVGIEIAGPGSGPAELSAVKFLGLTTQVPVSVHIAVPGRAPAPLGGITFHSRPYSRALRQLRPAEVAVLETLRIWPSGTEEDWNVLRVRVAKLIKQGIIRHQSVTAALCDERTPVVRRHWETLRKQVAPTR